MKKTSNTIVFFRRGPVAAESLQLLYKNLQIEAVITKPRLPHHRGDVPVLDLAEKLQIRTLEANDRQSLDKLFTEQRFSSKLGVLIDFGIIVSQTVIDYFPLGIVNSHFSLLPEWRGADPITFSILSGQKTTGVSLMLIVKNMDEGPLLAQATQEITPNMTTPELTRQLIILSHNLIVDAIPQYMSGHKQPYPQETTSILPSYSRKLTKEDGVVDWNKSAQTIKQEVQALIGWPKSKTRLGDLDIILTKVRVVNNSGKPGTINISNGTLVINCSEQAVEIDKLKPVGKQEMTGSAFLAGYRKRILI